MPSLGSRGEGWVALQLVALVLLFAAVWLGPPAPAGNIGLVTQAAGYLLGTLGAVLIGSGVAELRRARALTVLPHPRPEATLVETGAYRWVRHPIYGGLILGALGLALLAPWIGTFGAVALLAVVLDLKRRREETWLVGRFSDYEAYRARTRALIPGLY